MRGPNIHVVFSPKKNFQELQLHQILNKGPCQDHRILNKSVSANFQKKNWF